MKHVLDSSNIGLSFTRRLRDPIWQHIFVTKFITDKTLLSSRDNCYFLPLYRLNADSKNHLFHSGDSSARSSNIKSGVIAHLSKTLDYSVSPEDVFYYIYSVLYSNNFRIKFADFLKSDFPRLPLTSSLELFKELAKLGGELVALHLMESPKLDDHMPRFIGEGTPYLKNLPSPLFAKEGNTSASLLNKKRNTPLTPLDRGEPISPPLEKGDAGGLLVEKVSYSGNTVWIDKAQTHGFQGVPENVWNFHIGGYQVCQKWLKDRKGRTLSADDITHYHRIVVALNETIRIMAEIDKVIEQHGGWPGAFVGKQEEKKGLRWNKNCDVS